MVAVTLRGIETGGQNRNQIPYWGLMVAVTLRGIETSRDGESASHRQPSLMVAVTLRGIETARASRLSAL